MSIPRNKSGYEPDVIPNPVYNKVAQLPKGIFTPQAEMKTEGFVPKNEEDVGNDPETDSDTG